MHWRANNSQKFVKYMQCFAVVISTAFESNYIADTGLPRDFNHAIWSIKTRHSHSLFSKIFCEANLHFPLYLPIKFSVKSET